MNNYTVMFLMLFVASISGGMALKNIFEYSMLVGVGLAIVFLFCSIIALSKRNSQHHNKKA
ncbi:hypothetical protein [Bacillus salipaludis]|uniref:hypothetical protein n=1 Tax=Bacillus salipaludis TaxID=2547811 RepID=UPI002E1EB4FC|nr:hypothetical protein [Bacillus salipaludis]